MGLSEKDFWNLSPREFDALIKRLVAHREREDQHVGIIAATIANFSMNKKKGKVFKPEDFIGKHKRKRSAWQEQLKYVEMLNAALGGKDLRGKGGKHNGNEPR